LKFIRASKERGREQKTTTQQTQTLKKHKTLKTLIKKKKCQVRTKGNQKMTKGRSNLLEYTQISRANGQTAAAHKVQRNHRDQRLHM